MDSNKPNILKRFLDSEGLQTFWNNVINTINNSITAIRDELTNLIQANSNSITEINDRLELLRGYPVKDLDPNVTSQQLNPNVYNKITIKSATGYTFNFNSGISNVTNEYVLEIKTPTSGNIGSITLPAIKWSDESSPDIGLNKTYIISVINNCGVFGEY